MRRGLDIICSLVLEASHTNRLDCGTSRMKITDNQKLVHVYFGDSDPYAAAATFAWLSDVVSCQNWSQGTAVL